MSDSSTNPVQNKVIKGYVDENFTSKNDAENTYAKKEGEYDLLTAGRSKNFVGEPIPVTTGYTLKATGYDPSQPELEFADGQVNMTEIQGRACVWNQLFSDPTFTNSWIHGASVEVSVSDHVLAMTGVKASCYSECLGLVANHKFYVAAMLKASVNGTAGAGHGGDIKVDCWNITTEWKHYGVIISTSSSDDYVRLYGGRTNVSSTLYAMNFVCIDLTLLNPTLAAKANLTVAEVEAYLASIRTPKPYYAQNAGQLLGARMMGWQLRKTANLLNPTTKQAKLFEYAYTGHDNEYTVNGWDELTNAALQFTPYATGVAEAVALDANNRFVIPSAGVLEIVASGGDITGDISCVCVVATWDESMDGEIVAYDEDNVQIDTANIYLDSAGTQQAFTDGILRSTGDEPTDVHDRLYFDDFTKKWVADIKIGSRAYTSDDESDATVITDKTNTWYALTTPETHTNLYYKVGDNEYVPMEEVFPNGIQGLCCNRASENLVEQAEIDGQPQSITPITTEVFQSDYKELLKTIGDTYISKEQAKDSFDNLLSALNTNSATALGGTYATDGFNDDGSVKFTFTATTS